MRARRTHESHTYVFHPASADPVMSIIKVEYVF
jgi:hypothetical protein